MIPVLHSYEGFQEVMTRPEDFIDEVSEVRG